MCKLHPQFIKDAEGNNSMVVLPLSEYEQLLAELEDIVDVQAYTSAKSDDAGDSISLSEYLEQRAANEANG